MNLYGLHYPKHDRRLSSLEDLARRVSSFASSRGSQATLASWRIRGVDGVTRCIVGFEPAELELIRRNRNLTRNRRQRSARELATIIGDAGRRRARAVDRAKHRSRLRSQLDAALRLDPDLILATTSVVEDYEQLLAAGVE